MTRFSRFDLQPRRLSVAVLVLLATTLLTAQDAPPAEQPAEPPAEPPAAFPAPRPALPTQRPVLPTQRPTLPGRQQMPVPRPAIPTPPAVPGETAVDAGPVDSTALKFVDATADIVLQAYAEVTKRTLLMAPDVPKATITLRSQSELTEAEFLQAIETTLVMNGIVLEPVGDKFLKVLPAKDLRKLGVKTNFEAPGDGLYAEDGKMVSQMIVLQHISLDEARKAIEGFKRGEGQIQLFERTNSILVTDTVENVNRMMEIIKYIDQPLVNREETNVRPILHAKAADIKKRLEEIIAESQKAQEQAKSAPEVSPAGAPVVQRRTLPAPIPGVIRPPARPAPAAEVENVILETLVADAERGVIRGKVQIVADERTNLLIIITRPENMAFFDKIISVLDVETAPDISVEVIRLDHAVAEDVATMINDLIGNVKKDDSAKASSTAAGGANTGSRSADLARSQSLTEAASARVERSRQDATATSGEPRMSKVGELNKDNIKILADERTNALILMASKSDMATLRAIIEDMDIMLSQVMIESVVLEIGLSDKLSTGIDWVQRTLITGSGDSRVAYAGRGGGGSAVPVDPLSMTTTDSFGGTAAGISYYMTFFGLNVDAVIQAASSDSRTRTLASPVILTLDNKEATIEATQDRYFFKGKRYAGTQADGQTAYEDDVEIKSVGITVKVTPRINEKGFVVLKIDEKIQNIADTQRVNDEDWPIVASRNLSAEVAVQSGQTVVLGGLVQNAITKTRSKIPLLGDIPFLGRLFRSDRDEDTRNEVMVFLTPYVMDSTEALGNYARKRKVGSDIGDDMWKRSFSDSELADPPDGKTRHQVEAARVDVIATNNLPRMATPPQPMNSDHTTVTTNMPPEPDAKITDTLD